MLIYEKNCGPIQMIEMANCSSLLVLVGKTNYGEFSPKKIVLWGKSNQLNEGDVICSSWPFGSSISKVKVNTEYLLVFEGSNIHVFDTKSMMNLWSFEIGYVIAHDMSSDKSNGSIYLAYSVDTEIGEVFIYNLTTFNNTNMFNAHKSEIASICINYDNTMLATTSKKGTIIRVFSLPEGVRLFNLKRGISHSIINSLSFNTTLEDTQNLIVSSQTGTIHFFELRNEEDDHNSKKTQTLMTSMISGIYNNISSSLSDKYLEMMDYQRSSVSINSEEFKSRNIAFADSKIQRRLHVIGYNGILYTLNSDNSVLTIEKKTDLTSLTQIEL